MNVRVRLLSTDDPQTRAAKIAQLLGWAGDPKLIAAQTSVIADMLAQYAEIDVEAGRCR